MDSGVGGGSSQGIFSWGTLRAGVEIRRLAIQQPRGGAAVLDDVLVKGTFEIQERHTRLPQLGRDIQAPRFGVPEGVNDVRRLYHFLGETPTIRAFRLH